MGSHDTYNLFHYKAPVRRESSVAGNFASTQDSFSMSQGPNATSLEQSKTSDHAFKKPKTKTYVLTEKTKKKRESYTMAIIAHEKKIIHDLEHDLENNVSLIIIVYYFYLPIFI